MFLKEIFDVITPENIKDIPLLKAAMEVFIENLEENSRISVDIKKIYDTEVRDADPTTVASSKEVLRKALLDTYITALYNTLKKAQTDKVIKAKLESAKDETDDYPFIHDVEKILNDEYFITNKTVKQNKGTQKGIEYAYSLTKYLESSAHANDFNLYEDRPFHFLADGSVYREMYEHIVKPLSHPIGFTYAYSQIIKETLADLFGIETTYNVNAVEIRGLNGYIDVFTPDATDNVVKAEFLNRESPLTGLPYTEAEYNEYITVWTNKVVQTYAENNDFERKLKSVLFEDGTYVQQLTNPIEITYQEYSLFELGNKTEFIKEYDGHYSLFVDYDTDVTFLYEDTIEKFVTTLYVTKIIEDNDGEGGDQYYSTSSFENVFNVGGDVYPFVPGADESVEYYNDIPSMLSEIQTNFVTNITGTVRADILSGIVDIKIEDDFGNSMFEDDIHPTVITGDYSVPFNTYKLQGEYYTVSTRIVHEGVEYFHKFKTSGLNRNSRDFEFTNIVDNNSVSGNTILVEGKGPASTTLHITLTDADGVENYQTTPIDANGDWSIAMLYVGMAEGDFRIDAVIYEPNGKIQLTDYYEGSDLRIYEADVMVKTEPCVYLLVPDYSAISSTTATSTVDDIPGTTSTLSYVQFLVGELAEAGTFANPDQSIEDYLSINGVQLNELPEDLILMGSYIEGNDYDKSFDEFLPLEVSFINSDRQLFPIGTSDYIVMTNIDDVKEEFLAYGLSTTGYYLFSDDPAEDFYLYSSDQFYLSTLGDATI